MKYVRVERMGKISWGVLNGDTVHTLKYPPYAGDTEYYDGKRWPLSDCRLLAPCTPGKIVCLGKNYADHALEMGGAAPETPIIFMKTPNCVNDPEGNICIPAFVGRMGYEGELAFVIKRRAKEVKAADAWGYILGFTCLNDVTARDIQAADGQWTRGKCMDGFAPMGPVITDEVDPTALKIRTRLNGNTVQSANTALFLTRIPDMLAFITAGITLEPGDVVSTGTPAGIGPMCSGDTVEVEIEGIGVLRNHIVSQ